MFLSKTRLSIFLLPLMALLLAGGCEQKFVKDWNSQPQDMTEAMGIVPDSLQAMNLSPLVKAYYEGGDLYFIHTEASDSAVARLLTDMMGPQVVHMPDLAQVSDILLGKIYVFKNGIEGHGPFGYQPDIFPTAPGDSGYTPLRSVHLVRWAGEADPRELTSAEEIQQARAKGELTLEEPGIVVNMPVLVWPGGHR